jgi:predicted amidohydrolase
MDDLTPSAPVGCARVAVAQLILAPTAVEANRRRTVAAIEEAALAGADLVVLPELASSGYRLTNSAEVAASAETIPGPTTDAWRAAAAAAGCFVAGGVCERAGDRFYNSVALVGPDGVLSVYRKLHLFDLEQLLFTPGDAGLPTVDLPFGRLGMLVCYDLRFVEALRILAVRGADLIAVPTAWVGGFDPSPAPDGIIDQVRAVAVQANLSGVFVAAASRAGDDDGLKYLGSSCVVSPYGRFVLEPQSIDGEVVATVSLDLAEARRAKVRGPRIRPLADRRTDVYAELLGA